MLMKYSHTFANDTNYFDFDGNFGRLQSTVRIRGFISAGAASSLPMSSCETSSVSATWRTKDERVVTRQSINTNNWNSLWSKFTLCIYHIQQVCQSSLLSGWNVRWPSSATPWQVTVSMQTGQTDGRTQDRHIALSDMDAASIMIVWLTELNCHFSSTV